MSITVDCATPVGRLRFRAGIFSGDVDGLGEEEGRVDGRDDGVVRDALRELGMGMATCFGGVDALVSNPFVIDAGLGWSLGGSEAVHVGQ